MQQAFKPYTNLVLAIPHAVSTPMDVDWTGDDRIIALRDRYTDWFTDELFISRLFGVKTVRGEVSRLDCDLERLEDEPDRIAYFTSVTGDVLTSGQINRRVSLWHQYRKDVLAAAEGEYPLTIDCHSFPSDLAPEVDVCLGWNDDASRPPSDVLQVVKSYFEKLGYRVGENTPFANAISPLGYEGHSLMIEVNKHCYMDEGTHRKNEDDFPLLQHRLEILFEGLRGRNQNILHPFGSWQETVDGAPGRAKDLAELAEMKEAWQRSMAISRATKVRMAGCMEKETVADGAKTETE